MATLLRSASGGSSDRDGILDRPLQGIEPGVILTDRNWLRCPLKWQLKES